MVPTGRRMVSVRSIQSLMLSSICEWQFFSRLRTFGWNDSERLETHSHLDAPVLFPARAGFVAHQRIVGSIPLEHHPALVDAVLVH